MGGPPDPEQIFIQPLRDRLRGAVPLSGFVLIGLVMATEDSEIEAAGIVIGLTLIVIFGAFVVRLCIAPSIWLLRRERVLRVRLLHRTVTLRISDIDQAFVADKAVPIVVRPVLVIRFTDGKVRSFEVISSKRCEQSHERSLGRAVDLINQLARDPSQAAPG